MNEGSKRKIIMKLPYFMTAFIFANIGEAWRLSEGSNIREKMQGMIIRGGLTEAFSDIFPGFHPFDFSVGIICALLLWIAVCIKKKDAKKFRHGREYGSARWGGKEDIEPYEDKVFQNNIILYISDSSGVI